MSQYLLETVKREMMETTLNVLCSLVMLCNVIVLADWEKELWFCSLIVASWSFHMYGQDRESNIM